MKVSLKWLNQYVDVSEFFTTPERLAEIITQAGLEVENLEDPSQKYKHVVIGQVVELGKHPDADKLTLCQVDTGEGSPRQIVCGAKNHKQGDKVVVATPGAVLPGDFAIKKSKIRGVES
ncbi:MAG: phenylalanine--tRNA ligase subunit beta, partial [Bdellovibrionales bacterium]|nr:phenylalanine--tRNA ligase subunit beta [Bdellovibrionales bacterium]